MNRYAIIDALGGLLLLLFVASGIFLSSWTLSELTPSVLPPFAILFGIFLIFHKGRRAQPFQSYMDDDFRARRKYLFIKRFIFGPVLIFMGLTSYINSLAENFPYLTLTSIPGLLIISFIGVISIYSVFD